ncbi:MAG: VOC family protein, partial [Patescibacteria group bacterium]
MKDEDESARQGGDYFCHIVIPAKDMPKSAAFYRRVFGWLVEEVPNRASLDVLPPSGKGPSAELTQVEDRIVPAIYT